MTLFVGDSSNYLGALMEESTDMNDLEVNNDEKIVEKSKTFLGYRYEVWPELIRDAIILGGVSTFVFGFYAWCIYD